MGVISGLITSHKIEPAGGGMPGPPFAPTSAAEGLSVDPITGKIVWGSLDGTGPGAASDVTANREIEIGSNFMYLRNSGSFVYSALGGGEIDLTDLLNNVNTTFQPGIAQLSSNADLYGFHAVNTNTFTQGSLTNLGVFFDDGGGGTAQLAVSSVDLMNPGGDTGTYGAPGLHQFSNMSGQTTDITPGIFEMNIPSIPLQYLWTQDRISCIIGGGVAQDDIVFLGDGFTFNLGSGSSKVNMNSTFGIATDAPTGGVGGVSSGWQLGNPVAAVSALDTANYLEINAGGLLLKLALIV